jgi:phenylalanyl-tRNA synthetase beta chain
VLGTPGVRVVNDPQPGLHPSRSGQLRLDDLEVGCLGEVDPDVLAAYDIGERVAFVQVDLDTLLSQPHGERIYRPFSAFPSSDIDLAFEVDDAVPASDVEDCIREAGGELLWSVQLFDVYRGAGVSDGRRSLAFSLRLQAADRTLTDGDVAAVRQRVIAAVESALPATLRG